MWPTRGSNCEVSYHHIVIRHCNFRMYHRNTHARHLIGQTLLICVETTIFGWLMTNSCNCWMPITRFLLSLDVNAASVCWSSASFWSSTTRLDSFFVTVADDEGRGRLFDGSWQVSKLSWQNMSTSHWSQHCCMRQNFDFMVRSIARKHLLQIFKEYVL